MPIIARAHHWTDNALGGRDRTRQIGNWLNYSTPAGLIDACDPDAEEAPTPPEGWTGAYEFTHANRRSALQAFIGDSTDAANTALLGLRRSHRPECWLNIKAVNVNPALMTVSRAERCVSWPGLWDFSVLRWTLGRARVQKDIILSAPGHPAAFRFALRYPAGFSHIIGADGSISYRDASGAEWLRSPAPWAEDANGNRIRVACVAAPDLVTAKGTFPTLRLVPNAADLASAVYPVTVDPTTTISGTTDIQDAPMLTLGPGNETLNYGSSTSVGVGAYSATRIQRGIFRVASAAIPAGTISDLRLKMYRAASSGFSTQPGTLDIYVLKDANTWVEGTSSGSQQTGSCCWNYAKYATQAWAGSVGAGSSGTDYDADASPPGTAFDAYPTGDDVLFTVTLKSDWATAWRDATRVNNGIFLRNRDEGVAASAFISRSTENTSNQPTFEVDYTSFPPWLPVATSRRSTR